MKNLYFYIWFPDRDSVEILSDDVGTPPPPIRIWKVKKEARGDITSKYLFDDHENITEKNISYDAPKKPVAVTSRSLQKIPDLPLEQVRSEASEEGDEPKPSSNKKENPLPVVGKEKSLDESQIAELLERSSPEVIELSSDEDQPQVPAEELPIIELHSYSLQKKFEEGSFTKEVAEVDDRPGQVGKRPQECGSTPPVSNTSSPGLVEDIAEIAGGQVDVEPAKKTFDVDFGPPPPAVEVILSSDESPEAEEEAEKTLADASVLKMPREHDNSVLIEDSDGSVVAEDSDKDSYTEMRNFKAESDSENSYEAMLNEEDENREEPDVVLLSDTEQVVFLWLTFKIVYLLCPDQVPSVVPPPPPSDFEMMAGVSSRGNLGREDDAPLFVIGGQDRRRTVNLGSESDDDVRILHRNKK